MPGFYPELVIGFVAPSGVSFDRVTGAARRRLAHFSYQTSAVRLSAYLEELADLPKQVAERPENRIPELQNVGDGLRTAAGRGDILAFVAAGLIRRAREELNQRENQASTVTAKLEDASEPGNRQVPGMAFLVWSLKHPEEVSALRGIYGTRFFLISAWAPREQRVAWLSEAMASRSRRARGPEPFELEARKIIETDAHEPANPDFGQSVRKAFPLADFFVDASDDPSLDESMSRTIDIIFGHPFETPTRDEFGMYVAHAASLRSAELGRQVGAAIAVPGGDVVSTGTNEVPAFGGGHYWPSPLEERLDNREFRHGADQSDEDKRLLGAEVFDNFQTAEWIPKTVSASESQIYDALENSSLPDITEFGRAVHAEMSAITDAARRGVPTLGTTIYVTTFPCHTCARHVVAAGILRLVFIEPYPKSRATKLHSDVLATPDSPPGGGDKVSFEPFIGVAPRQYINAFTMPKRKHEGRAVLVDDPDRIPRLEAESAYGELDVAAHVQRERSAVAQGDPWIESAEQKVATNRRGTEE
jgi:deoxycytidylate deaminase